MKVKELQQRRVDGLATATYHHSLAHVPRETTTYTWEEDDVIGFDELIISWNIMRPQYGEFAILVSVKIDAQWTPWFQYAFWGCSGQRGGDVRDADFPLQVNQDILQLLNSQTATGLRICITASEGASLDECYSIHACTSLLRTFRPSDKLQAQHSIDLNVPLISQMQLPHPRCHDMCSAVATSSVVSYLLNKNRIDPIFFALQARDEAFNIFGNWVLNTAHASAILGKGWQCWVQRLTGFGEIYERLLADTPVVVSVRGPLEGSALPYSQGHLLVVKGYREQDRKVLCMDPAFSTDATTNVSYTLNDFMEAWSRRQCIAYLFEKRESNSL